MKWLLVAMVTFSNSSSPDLKVHGGLHFKSQNECNLYLKKYEIQLVEQLKLNFPKPKITNHMIKCITEEDAQKVYNSISKP